MTDPCSALAVFAKRVLIPSRAARFLALLDTKRGRKEIIKSLCHEFEKALRSDVRAASSYDNVVQRRCMAFHSTVGFGVPFDTVSQALDALALADGWLVLLEDGSAGIFRPEAPRWDAERLILT